jgi:hypothetical protein
MYGQRRQLGITNLQENFGSVLDLGRPFVRNMLRTISRTHVAFV